MKRFIGRTPCVVLAAALFVASAWTHAQVASFDCRQASTPTERAICSSAALGQKDVVVTTYYQLLLRLKPAMAGMAYREFDDGIRNGQRQWLQHDRDACGDDATCLGHAYDRRIDALLKTFDANAALTFGRSAG